MYNAVSRYIFYLAAEIVTLRFSTAFIEKILLRKNYPKKCIKKDLSGLSDSATRRLSFDLSV